MKKNVRMMTQAAMIAALYVVLTFFANAFGLANNVIQIRFSEALTILPVFTGAAVPGLFVGCLLSNILTGCMPLDIIFGSVATLLGALGTYLCRKHIWCAPLFPIVSNTIIVPLILAYVYHFEGSIFYFMVTVFIGELISCGALGILLYYALYRYKHILFAKEGAVK